LIWFAPPPFFKEGRGVVDWLIFKQRPPLGKLVKDQDLSVHQIPARKRFHATSQRRNEGHKDIGLIVGQELWAQHFRCVVAALREAILNLLKPEVRYRGRRERAGFHRPFLPPFS
jgi:hypothetical protein